VPLSSWLLHGRLGGGSGTLMLLRLPELFGRPVLLLLLMMMVCSGLVAEIWRGKIFHSRAFGLGRRCGGHTSLFLAPVGGEFEALRAFFVRMSDHGEACAYFHGKNV
jgi:hypothetical protein